MLSKPNPKRRPSVFKRIAVEYCESTTLHGFAYFVRAENGIERLSWIAITVISFVCAGFCISAAIEDWMNDPTTTVIQSFSKVFRPIISAFPPKCLAKYIHVLFHSP